MGKLNEKNAAMLDIQRKIDTVEEQLNDLKAEKRRMIREFNAPVIQRITESIKLFLKEERNATEDYSLDISDSGISIETGEYEDCNNCGYEGQIVYEANVLKIDEASNEVMIEFRDYCGPNESGTHEELLAKTKLSVIRRIVEYLEANPLVNFDVSSSALIFNGDADYYQKRIEQTDNRCNEFGIIPVKKKKIYAGSFPSLVANAEKYLKTILNLKKISEKNAVNPVDQPGVLFMGHCDPRQDEFVVSRGSYIDFKIRGRQEVFKIASCLFLDHGKVMVGMRTFYVEDNYKIWHEGKMIEKVPFAECAEWPYLRKDGTKGMLLDSIIECIDSYKPSLELVLPGPREFSTGAFTTDERYDNTGNLKFKEGITQIEPNFYDGCDKVEVVRIPNGVTEIGEGAFRECRRLRSVYLPDSLIIIGNQAFEGCGKLQKIVFPKGLRSIGSMAFGGCQSLKCINLPDNLDFIGSDAFSGVEPCYVSHGPIRIEREKIGIDEGTFLIDRTIGFQSENKDAFGDFLAKVITKRRCQSYFAIPEGITGIEVGGMHPMTGGFDEPVELYIPSSATDFFFDAGFGGAELITKISVSPDNPKHDSRGGCNAVIESKTDTLILGCATTVIPNTVKAIGNFAFEFCEGLTGLSIPEGVTTIGKSAFAGCENLMKVQFPNTLTEIGIDAFLDCFGLQDIVIPDSVTKIGEDAFGEITIRTLSIPKGLDISGTGLEYADKIIER